MKSLSIKKIVIIFTVLITIVASAVIVAYTSGKSYSPSLSDPDGVFYERLDGQGNVVYTITNKEMFDQIKKNDGVQQLLYMVDGELLHDYLQNLTNEEIQNKILVLTYGTSDADEIAALTADEKTKLEDDFALNIQLAGFEGRVEEYASLVLAREAYVRYLIVDNGDITDLQIAKQFINNTWEDISALRIRFMSSSDATAVMRHFNLLTFEATSIREYKGFIYKLETLLDPSDNIVEAYITVTPYYFDEDHNIVDLNDDIAYTWNETGNFYTVTGDDNEYYLDEFGNLLDSSDKSIIDHTLIFQDKATAETYKTENTTYYTVSKTDPFNTDEDTIVRDSEDQIAFTIDKDGKIYDASSVDVTATTDLFVNKVYTPIADVTRITENITTELTDQEVLAKFILMYNYIYGEYRDPLPEDATTDELIALDDANLQFSFDTVKTAQASLATYMFKTMNLENPYTPSAKSYPGANDTSYYLIYKLTQPEKLDAETTMIDNIESQIQIPTVIGSDITLPTTGWYGSTIAWTPSDDTFITNKGVVTNPDADTQVTMKYRITFNGKTRDGSIVVTILASGDTVPVDPSTDTEPTFESILNDSAQYDALRQVLVDNMLNSSSASTTVNSYLGQMRADYGFQIYDYYVGVDYKQTYSSYKSTNDGDKTVLASLTGRPGAEDQKIEITADEFYQYVLEKNAALYTMYATQYKELVNSVFFTDMFGTETALLKNKSVKMTDLINYVEQVKDQYPSMQRYYAQQGYTFPYDSFQEYIYMQYNGATNETELLQNLLLSTLQPYLIQETIANYDLLQLIYPTIEEDYQNYFSLNVSHLLMYFDFNEDGQADDYYAYLDTLDAAGQEQLQTLKANFETAIRDYLADADNTFTTMVSTYRAASREDDTWGVYKQKGFCLLTQDLNESDGSGNSVSITYSGTYGVKDKYVPEFVDALVQLYQEYILPQNATKNQMYSSLVTTVNGVHLILATKGDDFTQPSCQFAETDPDNPVYAAGLENASDMPSMDQLEVYAEYYFLSQIYDLSQTDVETVYGITVPKIQAALKSSLDFYAGDLIKSFYVVGSINIDQADRISSGRFDTTSYLDKSDAELMTMLVTTRDAYYEALFATYTQE